MQNIDIPEQLFQQQVWDKVGLEQIFFCHQIRVRQEWGYSQFKLTHNIVKIAEKKNYNKIMLLHE